MKILRGEPARARAGPPPLRNELRPVADDDDANIIITVLEVHFYTLEHCYYSVITCYDFIITSLCTEIFCYYIVITH